MVDVVAYVSVDVALVGIPVADDGEEIFGGVFGVFVEYLLHVVCPLDGETLAGFAPAICDVAVGEVGLSEIGHVDETHSSQHEADHEHISGKIQRRGQRQIEGLYLFDDGERQSSFDGLVDSGVDVAERIAVFDDFFFYGPVVDGPEYTDVEGDCVWGYPTVLMPCLERFH